MNENAKSLIHYDRFIGLPWYVDVGLLYYRRDILDRYKNDNEIKKRLGDLRGKEYTGTISLPDLLPNNLKELYEISKLIKHKENERGNKGIWGFVWQGNKSWAWFATYWNGSMILASDLVIMVFKYTVIIPMKTK